MAAHDAVVEAFWHGLVPFFWGGVCVFFLTRMVKYWPPKREWQWWWAQEGNRHRDSITQAAMDWAVDKKGSRRLLLERVRLYKMMLDAITDGRNPFEYITEAEYERRKTEDR